MEQPPTNGQQKIQEYVARIQNGESKAVVLAGVSPAFISGVEQQLASAANQTQPAAQAFEAGEKTKSPPVVYSEIIIDDAYVEANLVPVNGRIGLRMQGGQANWDGAVEIKTYVMADSLSPHYRQIVAPKIEKHNAGLEKTYHHEAKHIKNREHGLAPHIAAQSLREFLAFRVLDEMSAFTTGELYNQDITAETIMQALRTAEGKVASEYYGNPFTSDATWYLSHRGDRPETFTRSIDTERYHKILRHYFNINEQDILALLQRENRLGEFTNLINGLIGKLDQILNKMESSRS